MSQTGWTPVDESTSGWTPVQEKPQDTGVWASIKRNTVGAIKGLHSVLTSPPTQDEIQRGVGVPEPHDPLNLKLISDRLVMQPAVQTNKEGNQYFDAAKREYSKGNYLKAFNLALSGGADKTLAAAPVIGPAINEIAKRAESGDVSGALTDTAFLLTPKIVEGVKTFQPMRTLTPKGVPEAMYQSALKPSTKIPPAKVSGMIQAGLENEIPISKGGLDKVGSLIDDLNSKIQQQIDAGSRQGITVNKYAVASRLGKTAKQFSTQVNPNADLESIAKSGNEFLENQPVDIPASEAQAMKQGTYQQIRKSYGQLSNATVESQKALARGIKEELATKFPELNDLNAKESQLIGLDDALEKAVTRIGNHQIIGIGTPIAAGAAKAVTGSSKIGAIVGIMKGVLDNPIVKSKLAIAMSRKGVPLPSAMSRITTYSAALAAAANDAQNANQNSGESNQ